MRLLLIHQNFPGQFRELAPAWLAAGYAVSAIGHAPDPPQGSEWEGLAYWAYSFSSAETEEPTPRQRGEAVAQLSQWLCHRSQPPDLVMAHSGWGEALQLRGAIGSIPWVAYPELWGTPAALGIGFDSSLAMGQPGQRLWGLEARLEQQNLLAELAIVQADAAVVPSPSQRASFPEPLQQQLTVIPEGVNLERLQPDPTASLELESIGRLRAGEPIVTLVSRALEPLRGLREALAAWPQVAAKHPEARLVLVGGQQKGYGEEPPQGESHLADALSALPASTDRSRIHVLDRLPYHQLLKLIQCSACHLGLSYPYTLSWSLLEAMACAAPVITNEGSPLAEHLQDSESGVVVPFNQPEALAEAIHALLINPEKAQRLGRAGREVIQRSFNLNHSLQSYQTLFERLVAKR